MPDEVLNKRREERVALFVRANIHAQPGNSVVRLCNLSPVGALIEGQSLPNVGHEVELRRGALCAPGRIVWRGVDQAGISFFDQAEVVDWLRDAPPQASVDRAFQGIMEEFRERDEPVRRAAPAPLHNSLITIDDMERVAASLDELGDALADNPQVVMQFAEKLQTLDIATQLLRKLSAQKSKNPLA